MWAAMHENAPKPVDVYSENWQLASVFAGATLLDELNGCLDICARNSSRVAIDDGLRASA